ncbi:MAG: YhcB family protein [Hahellaceae bacterium]|nr:YhcB family protein [Hahellaceae bacterium]MCP5169054.1 YhcB family protein [Hahellaceae bacterium]
MPITGHDWMIAGVSVAIGLVLGVILAKALGNAPGKARRMERQFEDLQDQHVRYQAQVSEHFMETSQIFKRLNEDYAAMYNHMAKGAQKLCEDDTLGKLMIMGSEESNRALRDADQSEDVAEMAVDTPRDYAPKSKPEEKGTLSEDYGFKLKDEDDTVKS